MPLVMLEATSYPLRCGLCRLILTHLKQLARNTDLIRCSSSGGSVSFIQSAELLCLSRKPTVALFGRVQLTASRVHGRSVSCTVEVR